MARVECEKLWPKCVCFFGLLETLRTRHIGGKICCVWPPSCSSSLSIFDAFLYVIEQGNTSVAVALDSFKGSLQFCRCCMIVFPGIQSFIRSNVDRLLFYRPIV